MRLPLDNWKNLKRGYTFSQKTFYNDFHVGLDLVVPVTPLYAPCDGIVTHSVGEEGGNTVTLVTSRFTLRFLHLSKFEKKGQVKKGDLLGFTGNTGLSTGPHVHIDVSKGVLKLNDRTNFVNPEDFFSPVSVLVVGDRPYDFTDLLAENPFLTIDQRVESLAPQWEDRDKERRVSQQWFDRNVFHTGYDIVAFVTKNYEHVGTRGYAEPKQRLGAWSCIVHDTGSNRPKAEGWRKTNQVAGTLEHEINHLLHFGCGITDKTHDYDKGTGFPLLPLSKFKGREKEGYKWVYRVYKDKIVGREVKEKWFSEQFLLKTGFKLTV